MKMHGLLAATHLVAVAAGGLVIASFTWFDSLALAAAVSGCASALAVAAWLVALFLLRRGVARARSVLYTEPNGMPQSTGLHELDQLAQGVADEFEKLRQEAQHQQLQIREIDRLASQLGRRRNTTPGEPVSHGTELVHMLSTLADSFDSDIGQVITCGREIERCTAVIAGGAEQQSSLVNRTVSLIERISTQIDQVLSSAQKAKQASAAIQQLAVSGLQDIEVLATELGEIRSLVGSRQKRLAALGDHTREIGNIVETIGDISSRTDMLALNASIESVRAGEHGRGFAVVAEEVKTLAEQAALATRDVSSRIETIQSETQHSISFIEGEFELISQIVEKINRAQSWLEQIVDSSNVSATQTEQIANFTHQQVEVTDEFVDGIQKISTATQNCRSQVEGVRWTARSINKLATQINGGLSALKSDAAPSPELPEAPVNTPPGPTETQPIPPGSLSLSGPVDAPSTVLGSSQ